MIDAVIYGDTPHAKIEKLDRPPPDIILKISKKPNSLYIAEAQGIVIPVPKQKIPRHIRVK